MQLSVVMATHNRSEMLAAALSALDRQRGCDPEIVVIDDCSTDDTSALLARERTQRRSSSFQALSTAHNSGPAVARNVGWRAAQGEWIAFTDDDCEVDPNWLDELLRVAAETGCDIVQGRTIPNPDHPRDTPWARTVDVTSFSHRFQTCNLLVRRAVLEQLGGFDESYPFAGEDADLGWRATKAGYRSSFAPEALVLHAVRPLTCLEYLRSRMAWAQLTHFFKRHPEARFLLWARLFHRRTHLTAAIVVGALLSAGRVLGWWVPPILFATYVANNARRAAPSGRSLSDRLRFAALSPIAELWEAANFLRWSLHYRTLVL